MSWQRCPICNGAGIVSGGYFTRAGDSISWTASNSTETCRVCRGTGVISEITGLPPDITGGQTTVPEPISDEALREDLIALICLECDGVSHADPCELEKKNCPALKEMPDKLLALFLSAGYRRLEGEPPLLSEEELKKVVLNYFDNYPAEKLPSTITIHIGNSVAVAEAEQALAAKWAKGG